MLFVRLVVILAFKQLCEVFQFSIFQSVTVGDYDVLIINEENAFRALDDISVFKLKSNCASVIFLIFWLISLRVFLMERILFIQGIEYSEKLLSKRLDNINEIQVSVKLLLLLILLYFFFISTVIVVVLVIIAFVLLFGEVKDICYLGFVQVDAFNVVLVNMLKQPLFITPYLDEILSVAKEVSQFR